MLYAKNVPSAERVIRVLLGVGMLVASVLWLGLNFKGLALGASGLVASLTGLFGWCPMCAIAGRKLDSDH